MGLWCRSSSSGFLQGSFPAARVVARRSGKSDDPGAPVKDKRSSLCLCEDAHTWLGLFSRCLLVLYCRDICVSQALAGQPLYVLFYNITLCSIKVIKEALARRFTQSAGFSLSLELRKYTTKTCASVNHRWTVSRRQTNIGRTLILIAWYWLVIHISSWKQSNLYRLCYTCRSGVVKNLMFSEYNICL